MSVLSKELEMPHGLERMAAHGAACFSLKGKTVLVTGASGDIGAYVSQTAAAAGARVVLAARREERLSQVADTIAARGGSVTWVPLDLTDRESIDSCVAAAGEIDVLVNNAGVARPAPALIGGGVGEVGVDGSGDSGVCVRARSRRPTRAGFGPSVRAAAQKHDRGENQTRRSMQVYSVTHAA